MVIKKIARRLLPLPSFSSSANSSDTSLLGMVFRSRGTMNGLRRIATIVRRFGIGAGKTEAKLDGYVDILQRFGQKPTFPITAVTLKRHPRLPRRLSQQGVEFVVHGNVHGDYRKLDQGKQESQIKEAAATFKSCGIPFRGFRAPYLRSNSHTLQSLRQLGFLYDSSETLRWPVVDKARYPEKTWTEYERVMDFYTPRPAGNCLALPRIEDGLVEIPVSLPDDEALVDRLGITDEDEIARIWCSIASETYRRGELFVLNFHPERFHMAGKALTAVLEQCRKLDPPVWIAGLGEIATWWKEKQDFSFQISGIRGNMYKVAASCSDRATVLAQNCTVDGGIRWWSPGCHKVDSRDFVIEALSPPVIRLASGALPAAVRFIKSEGFIVEEGRDIGDSGLHLAVLGDFNRVEEKTTSDAIGSSAAPLVRFWRWPSGARSALAVTGDIDSMTLRDFVWRFFEV